MITEERLKENHDIIVELLSSTSKEGMPALIDTMESSGYFTAPASTRHHCAYRGGLAQHSLNVYNTLVTLNKQIGNPISDESVIIIALLHDYDKTYVYQEKFLKDGSPAKTPFEKKDILPLGHGEKTVMILQRFIKLTDQEMMCIRWHMGTYDKSFYSNETTIKGLYPEVMAVFFADYISSLFLEKD